MKNSFLILFFFNTFLSLGQSISGKLTDKETNKSLPNGIIYLLRPENTEDTVNVYYWEVKKFKILKSTKSDLIGNYSFLSVLEGEYTIIAEFKMPLIEKIEYLGVVQEIDSNVKIRENQSYHKNFKLPVTCRFEKTKKLKYCPICKRTDKVLPIEFGLVYPDFDSLGNLKPKPEVYNAGCIMDLYCNPTKYCKRCKLEF